MKTTRHMSKALLLWASIFLLIITPGSYAIAQTCVSPPSGLVSWWPGDGDATDIVGNNDGTLVGDATFTAGKVGQGFIFDGNGDYVEIPVSASLNLAQFTVDAWIFIDPAQLSPKFHAIVGNSTGSHLNPGFVLGYDTRNIGEIEETLDALQFFVRESLTSSSFPRIPHVLQSAGFYHVAGTFDGSVARLYLDGALVATGNAINFASFSDLPVRIGAMHFEVFGADDRFQGIIDEVEIYNRALSASEILAIFNAGSGGKCKVTTLIDDAINLINGLGLDPSTTATLVQKLQEARDKFGLDDLPDARSKVCAFVGELEAAVLASSLTTDDANLLLKKAGTILGEISFR